MDARVAAQAGAGRVVGVDSGWDRPLEVAGLESALDAARGADVANPTPFDLFPAKPLARGARAEVGTRPRVDRKGTLSGERWQLPLNISSVVLDRDGVVVFARPDKLGHAEQEERFRTLDDLLADDLLADDLLADDLLAR
ncbi:MAG TPA: hypothetical protein VK420_22945 [Longimicrobium sp.]|nr:hypothetical protein [Longimicrobium sp.]